MAWPTHTSIDGAFGFLNRLVAHNYRHQQLDYAICLAERPELVIGGAGVLVESARDKTMRLGYVLASAYWGQGLVPEAARLLLEHAFATTDVERIFAPIFSENERSRRVASKVGMTLDGVLRSACYLRGRHWDEAIYSILRSEWPPVAR